MVLSLGIELVSGGEEVGRWGVEEVVGLGVRLLGVEASETGVCLRRTGGARVAQPGRALCRSRSFSARSLDKAT